MRRRLLCLINAMMFAVLAGTFEDTVRNSHIFGPVWVSQLLFATASLSCAAVLHWPRAEAFRVLSGAAVGLAFGWRATSVLISWLTGAVPSLYGVALYVGLANVYIIGWADMLPMRPQFQERVARLGWPDAP